MAKVIKADGHEQDIAPANEDFFSLEEIQGVVKGYYRPLYLRKKEVMLVNDDGIPLGLPKNEKASDIAHRQGVIFPFDDIYGDVLICGQEQID